MEYIELKEKIQTGQIEFPDREKYDVKYSDEVMDLIL
jgi:hypothetical protein